MDDYIALQWLKGTLKGELQKRGLTYADLLRRLNALGVEETEGGLRNKLARGTFSAVYLCQCLEALGIKNFKIDLVEFVQAQSTPKYGVVVTKKSPFGSGEVVYLPWSHNKPQIGTVIELPSENYADRHGSYSQVCGNCEWVLLPGWSVEDALTTFSNTDLVAKCYACKAYNGLLGSKVKVEIES